MSQLAEIDDRTVVMVVSVCTRGNETRFQPCVNARVNTISSNVAQTVLSPSMVIVSGLVEPVRAPDQWLNSHPAEGLAHQPFII